MFEPFFFDRGRLFGSYHPASDIASDRLLVICPPLFDEYRRCFRALAELANGCAERNAHVLRFDYFGTGESYGTLEEADASIWVDDITAAIDEGIAISGAARVYLLGVRFGATLAAQVSHSRIVEYVFWDPVSSGAEYLGWLSRCGEDLEAIHRLMARTHNVRMARVDYQTFVLSPALRKGIGALRFDEARCRQRAPVHVVSCDEMAVQSNAYQQMEYPGFSYDWPCYHDGVLMPKPVLEAIARRLA